MEKENKPKESWDEWERMLREEGFFLNELGQYYNAQFTLAWEMISILDTFKDIADFREWIQGFKSDPERQKAVDEFSNQYCRGLAVGTDTIQ